MKWKATGCVAVVLVTALFVSPIEAKKHRGHDGGRDGEHSKQVDKGGKKRGDDKPAQTTPKREAKARPASDSARRADKSDETGRNRHWHRDAEEAADKPKPDMPVNLVPRHARHQGPSASADKREVHQEKRMEAGIHKGALTSQEQSELARQHDAILQKEQAFRADGKLSRDERSQLQSMLNDASRMIWTEKHDTEGRQLAVKTFGKNVFANDTLLKRVSDPSFSAADARAVMKDYRTMLDDRRRLSGDLPSAERARLQAEYNDLLKRYFEVRP